MYQLVNKSPRRKYRNVTKSVRQYRMVCTLDVGKAITAEGKRKLEKVKDWLAKAGVEANKPTGKHRDIEVQIVTTSSGLTAPAVTTEDEQTGLIKVEVADWYLNGARLGQLAGMLAHELGVHYATDQMMTQQQKETELGMAEIGQSVVLGGRTYTVKKWAGVKDKRQVDHVMAGQGKATEGLKATGDQNLTLDKGIAGESVRGKHYARLVNKIGKAIYADTTITDETTKDTAMRDLLESYLFDNARFVVTDDKMAATLEHPKKMAEGMNAQGQKIKSDNEWGEWAKNDTINTRDYGKRTPYQIVMGTGIKGLYEKTKIGVRKLTNSSRTANKQIEIEMQNFKAP